MSQRSQYLSYNFLQKIPLSPVEHALLNIIKIRPNYCLETLKYLGECISRSARTVQRAIKTLIEKGVLNKKYTNGKKMILTIATLETQENIAKNGILNRVLKFCAFQRKRNKAKRDKNVVSDTTSVSSSIKSSNEIKSILNTELKTKHSFEEKKKIELLRFSEYLKSSIQQ